MVAFGYWTLSSGFYLLLLRFITGRVQSPVTLFALTVRLARRGRPQWNLTPRCPVSGDLPQGYVQWSLCVTLAATMLWGPLFYVAWPTVVLLSAASLV